VIWLGALACTDMKNGGVVRSGLWKGIYYVGQVLVSQLCATGDLLVARQWSSYSFAML
jgi:hypothetical protein